MGNNNGLRKQLLWTCICLFLAAVCYVLGNKPIAGVWAIVSIVQVVLTVWKYRQERG